MGLTEASLALTSTLKSLSSELLREGWDAELSFGVTFLPVAFCHLAAPGLGIKPGLARA